MSIVSFSHRFIFLKTRKTAGTSIQHTLLPFCKTPDVVTRVWTNLVDGRKTGIEEFATIQEIEKNFNLQREEYFSFGFTRNPFDLTLSRYFYQIKERRITGGPSKIHFNQWVEEVYLVGEPGFPHGRYFKDRSRFLLFDCNLNPTVDYIGRFESLQSDFEFIRKKIGLEGCHLVHHNRSNEVGIGYRDWINQGNRERIADKFDFEIEYFGYRY